MPSNDMMSTNILSTNNELKSNESPKALFIVVEQ